MAQNPLDELAPRKEPSDPLDELAPVLDEIAPKKKPRGAVATGVSMLMSPIPAVRSASRKLSDRVDITPRSSAEDTGKFEVPETAAGWGELAKGLVTMPARGLMEAPGLWRDVVKLIHDKDPSVGQATRRGLAAGLIDIAGDTTPLDIVTAKTGQVVAKKALGWDRARQAGKTATESSPGSRALIPEVLPAPAAGAVVDRVSGKPLRTPAPATAPEHFKGATLVRKKAEDGPRDFSEQLSDEMLREMVAERRAKLSEQSRRELPPAEPPQKRLTEGRTYDPYTPGETMKALPEVGGQEGTVRKSIDTPPESTMENLSAIRAKSAFDRQMAAMAELAEREAEKAADASAKLPDTPRTKRPAKKLSEVTAASPVEEIAEAVNAVARKEPEVLAPRNPNLEAIAKEMEEQPLAPNPEVNAALVGERVPSIGMQQKPQTAAGFTPEAQKQLGAELMADPAAREGGRQMMRRLGEINANRVAEPDSGLRRRATDTVDLRDAANADIKEGFDDIIRALRGKSMSGIPVDPDLVVGMGKMIKGLARRGVIEAEAVWSEVSKLIGEGADKVRAAFDEAWKTRDPGAMPKLVKPSEMARKLESERRAVEKEMAKAEKETAKAEAAKPVAGKPFAQMTDEEALEAINKEDTGEVDLEADPLQTSRTNEGPLTQIEKMAKKSLEESLPQNIVEAIQANKPYRATNPDMATKAARYARLISKITEAEQATAKAAKKVEAEAPKEVPPPPDVATPITGLSSSVKLTPEQMLQYADEAGKGLTPELKAALDSGDSAKIEAAIRGADRNTLQAVSTYSGWRDRAADLARITARNQEITKLAQSNLTRAGGKASQAEDFLARSEKMAEEIGLPKAEKLQTPGDAELQAIINDPEFIRQMDEIKAERMARATELRQQRAARKLREAAGKVTPLRRAEPKLGMEIDPDLPPKGVDPEAWKAAAGFATEAGWMAKQDVWDPRVLAPAYVMFGAEELARRMSKVAGKRIDPNHIRELVKSSRNKPLQAMMVEADKRANFMIDNPKGFVRTELLAAAAGAAAGGMMGATFEGETLEDQFANTVSMMVLGGLAGVGGTKLVSGKGNLLKKVKPKAEKVYATIEELDTAQLLAGPAAIKASLGSVGGVAVGILEQAMQGNTNSARAGMRFMQREAAPMYARVLKRQLKAAKDGAVAAVQGKPAPPSLSRGKIGSMTANIQKSAGGLPTAVLDLVLAPFIAADEVSQTALRRMGYSPEEAQRMMLNGEPTSWQGQSGLNTINSMWLTRMLIKFPRVRLQSLERGIEYTPGLSKMFASGHGAKGAKRTVSGSGYKDFHTRSAHGAEQLPEKARQAKVKLGAAAMAAGGLYGYLGEPDPMMVGLVSSGLGPIALPFAVMAAGGAGLKKGLESDLFTGLRRGVMEGGLEAASAIPQSTETGVRAIASGERFIPGKPFSRLLKLIGAMDDDAAWPLDWTEEQ